jgi:7-cyano-7-deazaguanine synthase in queuosine biosynthesis
MPTERVILCGDAPHARLPAADQFPLVLDTSGPGWNVRLGLTDLTSAMWRDVPDVLLDLLDVATYVYVADQAVSRGEDREADFGDAWRRRLFFRIAVRDRAFWTAPDVGRALVDLLSFLSDDEYYFEFVSPKRREPVQPTLQFDGDPFDGRIEEVALFSGGLDSLGGAVQTAVARKTRMMLVHHRSNPKLGRRHDALLNGLRAAAPEAPPVHIPVRINKKKGLTREGTQRTRSFLFAAIAATLANSLQIDRVRFYENGVVSLNLPPAGQVVGARATRTTHPRVLKGYEALLGRVLGRPFTVENPFLWHTKTKVVKGIAEAGCGSLIRHSTSCARVRRTTRDRPHCGVCSQCIDRRFAILAASQEGQDPATGYEVDLLVGPRAEGHEKTMLAIYVEMATQIGKMATWEFFRKYGEAARVLRHVGGTAEAVAANVFALHREHALAVTGVVDQALARYAARIRERSLPPDCLLRMISDQGVVAVTAADDRRELPRNSFRKKGAGWLVRFQGGEEFILLPSRGASYLYELVRRPNVPTSAVRLMYTVTQNPALHALGESDAAADRDARTALRARLAEIAEEIEDARQREDAACEEELSEERTRLLTEAKRTIGIHGRPAQLGDVRRRVSKAVGNAISRAIAEIRKYDAYLADHFDSTDLRRGNTLLYAPSNGIEWVV